MSKRFLRKCKLTLQHIDRTANQTIFHLKSIHQKSGCPVCNDVSNKIHSTYVRKLNDLPRSGRSVQIHLTVRRFFCEQPFCKRKIFTERFQDSIKPWARKTSRLIKTLKSIAFSVGGEEGKRLSNDLGIDTSADTLLRITRKASLVSYVAPKVIGIDDWAYKKGQNYGTIICDLESGRPIDLLPDRSADSLARWLQKQPTVSVVSRDRAGVYASGVEQGAPQAIQVADRWHILKNLGDKVEQFLQKYSLPRLREPQTEVENEDVDVEKEIDQKVTGREKQKHDRRERKWKRVQEVQSLHQKGMSIRNISQYLCLARQTVRKYLQLSELPKNTYQKRGSCLDPYKEYILNRLQEGCHNAMQLFREIRGKGYPGGNVLVRIFVAEYRDLAKQKTPLSLKRNAKDRTLSPRFARRVMWKKRTELTEKEQYILDVILQIGDEFIKIYCLIQSFRDMMTNREPDKLEAWLQEAENSGIVELHGFASGIRRDFKAVHASLYYEWSNGPVEGHINRLKLIKRQMYGRASFDLLRNRVLHK